MVESNETFDPVTAYAEAVVSGEILAGRLVHLACQRHLDDLRDGPDRGLKWDLDAALRAIEFFGYLLLSEGQFSGQPFVLQPWEKFIVGSVFGWKGPDGFRRFRTAYNEIGKGNGKSPLAAGVGLYGVVADDEDGAEVYSAATTREQAGILFRDAKLMAEGSPALRNRLDVGQANIACPASNSYFRPVSSEHRGLDGKRVHMALIDEVHEHPSPLVVDKMRAGTKGRRQALIFEITNSGYDRESVCWHHHEYSRKILEGNRKDDSWFAYVCQLDEGDDWTDERVWIKANPNLGVSVTLKYLREQVLEAQGMPTKKNIVLRLNFCYWTETDVRWLPMELWDQGGAPFDVSILDGKSCHAGLDFGWRDDYAALVLVFPVDDLFYVLCFFWLPKKGRRAASEEPLATFLAYELVELTEGSATDIDAIYETLRTLSEKYTIQAIVLDPSNARKQGQDLMNEGYEVIEFVQSKRNYNEPCRFLESLLKEGKLRHGGHKVLRWMASNAAAELNGLGELMPKKKLSAEKIDGICALVMALSQGMVSEGESVYDTQGVDFL